MPSFEHQDFVFIQNGKTVAEADFYTEAGEGILKTASGVEMAGITTQYFTTAFLNKSDFLPSITKKVEAK